ncbi:MAG: zf-HC2 domain-containing protein [Thermoanaerobaculia bacterium]|jgi:predicted anti-sigma-YlaC factor YlaD|nr:zf-HC2 domain-containing protein [Thermoanaerobaculia bacterium]MBP9822611.1 zf-HC2 domain-containing protein [Thermoanaerobaculia bacterium]
MSCHDLELHLEGLLAGTLPAAEARRCAEHLAGCALCRDLLELARLGDAAAAATAAPAPDLAPAVLAQSGIQGESGAGRACGRAHELLAAEIDEPLAEIDRDLLHGHLAACGDCRALHAVLLELARDLPRLAEVRPDPAFVAEVLRRTLPFEVQIRRWWDALWPQLWHRPRFASEVAYVGVVALALVFATPGSPLAAVPSGALAIAQEPPLPRLALPEVALAPRLAAAKRALRASPAAEVAADWSTQLRATADDAGKLMIEVRTHVGTFWDDTASLLETRDDAPSSAPETTETFKEK